MNWYQRFLAWLLLVLARLLGPLPATGLYFLAQKGKDMAAAKVTVAWTPSASPGIQTQKLTLTVNGAAQPLVSLAGGIATYTFMANEKDTIDASLVENDGVLDSAALTGSYTVPEVTPPAPATNLVFTSVPA